MGFTQTKEAGQALAAAYNNYLTVTRTSRAWRAQVNDAEVLDLFRRYDALLEGHFILSSGLHSNRYMQCALVLQHPLVAERLGSELAWKLSDAQASVVVAPAIGGILVAHEVGRALGVRALFTERVDSRMTLRRGFQLAPDEPVVVVEDVITTGGSTRETIAAVEEAGGKVVAAGALVDRSGGTADLGLRRESLVTISVQTYDPAVCPLCADGVPATKPGSRTKAGGPR